MLNGKINFLTFPKVGFAHHFYTDKEYDATYGCVRKSIEIAYVKSGQLRCRLENREFLADEGSFLVLFRHLPIEIHTTENVHHSHCCIQLICDYDFELSDETIDAQNIKNSLIVPFVLPPCQETEELKKMLFSAVSDIDLSREKNEVSASITGLAILQQLSRIYQKTLRQRQDSFSLLEYKIKKYISQNIARILTLSDIAKEVGKTPNYINSVFREKNGITIRQYINQEKIRLLCELIQNKKISFKSACENIGVFDVSYGYRLFKKHTGITPKEFLISKNIVEK